MSSSLPPNSKNPTDDATQWLDFYSILGVSPTADEGTLRARIREAYLEAIRNSDHRQVERRLHFQVMSQRIIPQARRILLENRTRRAYDQQLERHQHGDTHAVPYTTFVTQLTRIEAGDNPFAADALPTTREIGDEAVSLQTHLSAEETQNLLDSAHQVLMTEQKFADMSPIPTLTDETSTRQEHNFFVIDENLDNAVAPEAFSEAPVEPTIEAANDDASEGKAATKKMTARARKAALKAQEAAANPTPEVATDAQDAPIMERTQLGTRQSRSIPAPNLNSNASTVSASGAKPTSSTRSESAPSAKAISVARAGFSPIPVETESTVGEVRAQVLRADGSAVNNYSTADRSANLGLDELDENLRGVVTSQRAEIDGDSPFTTRVDVGEVNARAANAHRFRRGQRILSQRLLFSLAGFIALSLIYLIQLQWRSAAVGAQPLRIVYASALQPVMGTVASNFLKTPEGADLNIELRPMDARDAMQIALSTSTRSNANTGSDIWIPSETLWSDRFNSVAAARGQRPLVGTRALALSPLVLMVRSDRAQPLRRRFPNRMISSWSELREAVSRDAAGHFGLTDPQKSGSGALARYFMAREWSRKNNVSWDAKGVKDARLWLWMNEVENNVPSYARLTSEMAKDLALGNADRYWWAVVYESDALGWMKRNQNIEVFYLPQTAYADHPFCAPDQPQMTSKMRNARDAFERYLRSAPAQKLLAQNGFRPTEIALSQVPNNLFTRPDFQKRGVRASGFRVDERINYRILNALTAQWQQRF